MNIAVIAALFAQSLIAKISRLAGAVVGLLVTTGILIWGMSLYADGDAIAFFGLIELPNWLFVIACLVWYAFDIRELMGAIRESAAKRKGVSSPLLEDRAVQRFYENTRAAWSSGVLSKVNKSFQKEGQLPVAGLIKKYPPYEGSALETFFEGYPPDADEFLIATGNAPSGNPSGWFVLTNRRLVQRDGESKAFKEVVLADVDTHSLKPKDLTFQLKSGEEIGFHGVALQPLGNILSAAITTGFGITGSTVTIE